MPRIMLRRTAARNLLTASKQSSLPYCGEPCSGATMNATSEPTSHRWASANILIPEADKTRGRLMRLLIVDDDDDLRDALERRLTKQGLVVSAAANLADAVAKAEEE